MGEGGGAATVVYLILIVRDDSWYIAECCLVTLAQSAQNAGMLVLKHIPR